MYFLCLMVISYGCLRKMGFTYLHSPVKYLEQHWIILASKTNTALRMIYVRFFLHRFMLLFKLCKFSWLPVSIISNSYPLIFNNIGTACSNKYHCTYMGSFLFYPFILYQLFFQVWSFFLLFITSHFFIGLFNTIISNLFLLYQLCSPWEIWVNCGYWKVFIWCSGLPQLLFSLCSRWFVSWLFAVIIHFVVKSLLSICQPSLYSTKNSPTFLGTKFLAICGTCHVRW